MSMFSEGYKDEWSGMLKAPHWITLLSMLSGLSVGAAHIFANAGFRIDPISSGPLAALVSSQVFVVTLFFWIYAKEALSCLQLLGVASIFSGGVIMSWNFGQSGSSVSIPSISLCLGAMLCFACS